jgi:hypothetical protein
VEVLLSEPDPVVAVVESLRAGAGDEYTVGMAVSTIAGDDLVGAWAFDCGRAWLGDSR